jgi:hypothetical protein
MGKITAAAGVLALLLAAACAVERIAAPPVEEREEVQPEDEEIDSGLVDWENAPRDFRGPGPPPIPVWCLSYIPDTGTYGLPDACP